MDSQVFYFPFNLADLNYLINFKLRLSHAKIRFKIKLLLPEIMNFRDRGLFEAGVYSRFYSICILSTLAFVFSRQHTPKLSPPCSEVQKCQGLHPIEVCKYILQARHVIDLKIIEIYIS